MIEDKHDRSTDPLTMTDSEVIKCPYPTYEVMLDQHPVYYDPIAKVYVISRYEDVRRALLDPQTYVCGDFYKAMRNTAQKKRADFAYNRFREKGWVPGKSILMLPPDRHREVRQIFEKAFRASRIKDIDDNVRDIAYQTVQAFCSTGHSEIVSDFSVPFPLLVFADQLGVSREDIWVIKEWTDHWINRAGMMLSDEEDALAVDKEIESQHYFKKIVDHLRLHPDDSVLSDLVNTPLSDGETLNDGELFIHILADLFVAGSETTTNALSGGVLLLCHNPDLQQRLQSDLDGNLRIFIEEVLRLESPVQGLFRIAGADITLHGVTIPEGAIIQLRYGAANRDERHFTCPAEMHLDRKNAASHVAFGAGIHHCIGAPLARRELYWGFKALLDHVENIKPAPGKNDFDYMPSISHRALKHLHITFTPKTDRRP